MDEEQENTTVVDLVHVERTFFFMHNFASTMHIESII